MQGSKRKWETRFYKKSNAKIAVLNQAYRMILYVTTFTSENLIARNSKAYIAIGL